MRESPPQQLVEMLDRLGLAAAADLRGLARRARRLSGGLPPLESVWVDVMAQARALTPWQAAQINAGRGPRLRVGPFVLVQPAAGCDFTPCYRARRVESGETVRLAIVETNPSDAARWAKRLQALSAASAPLGVPSLAPLIDAGTDGDRLWAASRWLDGRTAADWIVHHGRFPPDAVLEIARAMLPGLLELQRIGLCHGDISAASLLLTDDGSAVLLQPGLRGIVRPHEGYAAADLRPEAYDYLAPERIEAGSRPSVSGDIYACGCLWWHMACGRPPLGGGDSLAKLRAAQRAAIFDPRRLAPDLPRPLASAIAACTEHDSRRRPESMATLAAMLGPPGRGATAMLARSLGKGLSPAAGWAMSGPTAARSRGVPRWATTAALLAMAALAGLWPLWQNGVLDRFLRSGPAGRQSIAVEQSPKPTAHRPAPRLRDTSVIQASHLAGPADLVLAADRTAPLDPRRLEPGQCVRSPIGRRATVAVGPEGLAIDVDDVRFENVDFLGTVPILVSTEMGLSPSALSKTSSSDAAIVRLRVGRAEFRGCTFQSTGPSLRAAIDWIHPADRTAADATLPCGRLRLTACVFRGVGAAVDCHTAGALGLELDNVLWLACGPAVRLDHLPRQDEPVSITLNRVTLREGGPLVELYGDAEPAAAGDLNIQAAGCVLAPGSPAGLLVYHCPGKPSSWPRNVKWTGQGCLVPPGTAVALWHAPDQPSQPLDDTEALIAGLAPSKLGFAGTLDGGVAAQRLIKWQGPSQSADTPGADVEALPRFDIPRR